jgi:hypothetical protein
MTPEFFTAYETLYANWVIATVTAFAFACATVLLYIEMKRAQSRYERTKARLLERHRVSEIKMRDPVKLSETFIGSVIDWRELQKIVKTGKQPD